MVYVIYRKLDGNQTKVAVAENLAEAGKLADACRAIDAEGAEYVIKREEKK